MRLAVFVACLMYAAPALAREDAASAAAKSELDANATDQLHSEMLCATAPMFEAMVIPLLRKGLISKRSDEVYDSMNVYRLRKPIMVDGIRVVAIFGYQSHPESGLRFRRSPGTAEDTAGIITDASEAEARAWAKKMSPNLMVSAPSNSRDVPGIDISCSELHAPR